MSYLLETGGTPRDSTILASASPTPVLWLLKPPWSFPSRTKHLGPFSLCTQLLFCYHLEPCLRKGELQSNSPHSTQKEATSQRRRHWKALSLMSMAHCGMCNFQGNSPSFQIIEKKSFCSWWCLLSMLCALLWVSGHQEHMREEGFPAWYSLVL